MKLKMWLLLCCSALLFAGCGGSSEAADVEFKQENSFVATEAMISASSETAAGTLTTDAPAAETTKSEESSDGLIEEALPADAINYFVFRRVTKHHQTEQGQDLLVVNTTEPAFLSFDNSDLLHSWVNDILSDIYQSEKQLSKELLDYAKAEQEIQGEDFYSYSHYMTMGVGRHDTHIASILMLSSVYSGGAYPNSVKTAKNLDMRAMTVLTLEDILQENAADTLMQLVLASIKDMFAQIGEGALYDDYELTVQNALTYGNMTSHWYFNETGLVVFFNQYELAPHAAGIIKAQLSYDQLNGIVKEEYFPAGYSGTADGVTVDDEYPMTMIGNISFGEGDWVNVRVKGKASHVQLSNVFFAEGTPVGESMLFSANYLDESVTLAIQGDWKDEQTMYGVEYSDETGGSYVIYTTAADVWAQLP